MLGFDNKCLQFKLSKLNRMTDLKATDTLYDLQEIPPNKLDFSKCFDNKIQAVVLFNKSEKYRLIEEYGKDSFSETEKGLLQFEFPFTHQEYLISWVLSCGDKAELIEPVELRTVIKHQLENLIKKYF